jgi:methylenetetrahydrofolate dehydrogenase (NADP+)/methenyltetrahydrofolate cyclohydrolase
MIETRARIIDGKASAQLVRSRVRERCEVLKQRGVTPGLVVVLVGEDPASQVYVKNKDKAATEAGFAVRTVRRPATISQTELLALVRELNGDPSVHGILVQLPLPKGLDSEAIVRALDPAKDVDGLHPENVAALAMGTPGLVPCTPAGCIELCDQLGAKLVGKPFALLALARDATVTICHSKTADLPGVCRDADVLVAAVGRPEMVKADWIRPGAIVLDVGINRLPDGRLVGDVDFAGASAVAGAITPVPGGVGPMTIAMLMANTLTAAARSSGHLDLTYAR